MNPPKQAKRSDGLQLPPKVSDKGATLLKAYGMRPPAPAGLGVEKLQRAPAASPRVVARIHPDRLQQLVPPVLPPSPADFRFHRPKTGGKRRKSPCQGAAVLLQGVPRPGTASQLPVSWRRHLRQRPSSSGATSRGHREGEVHAVRSDHRRRSSGYPGMSKRLATLKESAAESQGRRTSGGSLHSHEEAAVNFSRIISGGPGQETRTFALWELYKLAREENMTVEEVVRMKQLFDDFDEDHGGTLDIGEFENVALRLLATQLGNTSQAQERARNLCEGNFKLMDSDGSGEVDFHEFLRWYSSRCFSESLLLSDAEREIRELAKNHGLDVHTVDKVKEYFDAADTDGSGAIQYEEFAEVLPKMLKLPEGTELPASRTRFFWREADVNKDKNIVFREFLNWWTKHLTSETEMQDFLRVQNPEIMVNFYRSTRRLGKMILDPVPVIKEPEPLEPEPPAEPIRPSASMLTDAGP